MGNNFHLPRCRPTVALFSYLILWFPLQLAGLEARAKGVTHLTLALTPTRPKVHGSLPRLQRLSLRKPETRAVGREGRDKRGMRPITGDISYNFLQIPSAGSNRLENSGKEARK